MKKRPISLLICTIMLLTALLCPSAAWSEEEEQQPTVDSITVGSLNRMTGSFLSTWFGSATADLDVQDMIHGYNPVIWANQMECMADPQVVRSIDIEQKGDTMVFTVHLANDLKWNDGTDITAEDYVFSYLLGASPELISLGADSDSYAQIVGQHAYASGETGIFAGIRLVDDYSYSVTADNASLSTSFELACLSVNPYPISVIAPGFRVADDGNGAYLTGLRAEDAERRPGVQLLRNTMLDPHNGYLSHPTLTSGPYTLTAYDGEAGRAEFVRNPWYKGDYLGGIATIEKVTFEYVPADEAVTKMATGELDLLNKVTNGDIVREIMNQGLEEVRMQAYSRLGYSFLTLNAAKEPMNSAAVRQAIAYAFDRTAFTTGYTLGFGVTVNGCYGLGQWMYQVATGLIVLTESEQEELNQTEMASLETYDYDPEKAVELLKADGWVLDAEGQAYQEGVRYRKNEEGTLVPLTMNFARNNDNEASVMAADMLREALEEIGGTLEILDVSFDELLKDTARQGEERLYDIGFMGSNFNLIFDPWLTNGSLQNGEWEFSVNGVKDEKLEAAALKLHSADTIDIVGYVAAWIDYQKQYNELLPTIPVYTNSYFDFAGPNLEGYNIVNTRSWPVALLHLQVEETDEFEFE